MEKQKNVVFSTALSGYKKQDVNAFIATLNANYTAAEGEYQKQIAALKSELAELRARKDTTNTHEAELIALRDEVASLKAQLSAAQTEQPSVEVDREEIEALRKKAALYDHMSSQLGDMMITANHNADKLLTETRQDAEQTLSAAKTAIAGSASLLSSQLEAIYRSANTRSIGEISSTMQQTQRAINKFLEELSGRRARLEEMLKQNDADTRRAADEQIAKMLDQTQDAIAAIGAKPAAEQDGESKA